MWSKIKTARTTPLKKRIRVKPVNVECVGYEGKKLSTGQLNAILLLLHNSTNPISEAVINYLSSVEVRKVIIKSFRELENKFIEAQIANHLYSLTFPSENEVLSDEEEVKVLIDGRFTGQFKLDHSH
jgi:hypothetical protein